MFIRVKTKPGSPSKSVQLVESVREGQTAGQRIVRHVGVAKSEAELEKLMELGETIKVGIRCERQPSLLPQEKLVDLAIKARREKAKTGPPVVIEETREEHRVVTGFHEASEPSTASLASTSCCRPRGTARRARRCDTS